MTSEERQNPANGHLLAATILRSRARGRASTHAPRASPLQQRGTVLVAEDEAVAREVSRAFLENAGFQVLLAADGEEALRCFHEHKDEICAVVLDRAMPELSGELVYLEIIRERPTMPVVVSSGYAAEDMLELFRGDAPLKFLLKPWRGADLLRALEEVLHVDPPQL